MDSFDRYRDCPTPGSLLDLADDLNDPGCGPVPEAITPEWLRREGQRQARAGAGQIRRGNAETAGTLCRLRKVMAGMGVPCGKWEATPALIGDALQRRAQAEYDQAVRHMSPVHGWRVLHLWAGGLVPSLDGLAPGARCVVISYAIRYISGELREAPEDGYRADLVLGELGTVLASLGPGGREEFRRAGLPGDEAEVDHARKVAKSAMYWRKFRDDPGWGDSHALLAAVPFRNVLALRTVAAAEIGTTGRDMTAAGRAWAAGHARRIAGGDYSAFDELYWFVCHSRLGYEAFGITGAQAGRWREEQARHHWNLALSGDGDAALRVICYCQGGHETYAQVSGLTDAAARDILGSTLTAHAAGLRQRAENAPGREEAACALVELRDFADTAREFNRLAQEAGLPRPVDSASWEMPDEDWDALHDRYVRTR